MTKALATKNVASVLVAVGLVLALSFAFATPAKAQTIADLQAQINALLAQIAALQGGTPTSGGACFTFTRNHQMGDTGGEVMQIQKFLNANGAQVAASGAGSPGNETSYFGALTRAAVSKFQAANGITPTAGYWGPITRAKANSMCTGPGPIGPGPVVPGSGLRVAVAPTSGGSLVQGQAIAELARFTFTNGTAAPINVTNLSFKRIGVSNDATLSNVYLFNGATRLTDSAGVSNTAFSFNAPNGIFTVPAGSTVTISVRSDIAGSTSGEQVGVQLVSVAASTALDASVVLPISGPISLISSATLATVDFNSTTLPSASSVDPQNDYVLWQNTVTIGTRAVRMESFQLRNLGSVDNADIVNLRLYVDGVQVGSIVPQMTSGEISVAWDLSANPVTLQTGGRVIKVVGDIVGGSGDTVQFSLRRAADARFVDTELGQPVLATANGSSFSARSATSATIGSATLSVTRAADSPTSNVAASASNVLWARFQFRASGEDVKIESLDVQADTSIHNGGLDNGRVFVNGVQVGSTKDINEASDTSFTFGSSFIAKAGQVMTVEIYADAKTSTSTALSNGETVVITLDTGSSNAFGQTSLTAVNAPSAAVTGNTITVSSSSLTGTKASGYGNQTMIAGTNNAKLGSFTLSTGSTEGVNVNTIVVDMSSANASTVTDLRLVDASTGAQIGTTKPTPSTSNSYSVNFSIPASGTKTIDVIGNIKSGANDGTIVLTLDTTTGGTGVNTGNSVTTGSDATLQTITIGSGTLTAGVGVSPDNANVVAGSSNVKVGSFNFTASNANYTVQEVKVKVPADAATSVSNVTLKYKDAAGADQSVSQSLTLSSGAQTHATATFTGLTFYVPQNTTKTIDVYVDVPTITSGAKSGASITVLLDGDEGFKAIDSAGSSDTTLTGSSSDLDSSNTSGKGTMVVRKTIPTLSAVALDTATLSAGSDKVIGRVKVTADAAGDVDWGQMIFTVNKNAALTLGATTTVKVWEGSSEVAGTFATTSGSLVGQSQMFPTDSTNGTSGKIHFRPTAVRTVAAGGSATYELRTTIGGLASGANYVDISIANPSTSVTTAIFSTAAGTLGTDGNASFVWSDWSDTADHASSATGASTADWTNDYLVKTLPLTIGNKSVSI